MLRIGMILCIVIGALLIFSTPFLITVGVSSHIRQMIVEAVESGNVNSDYAPEVAATIVQVTALSCGITLLIAGLVCVASAIVASKALKDCTRRRYIAAIVLGSMTTGFTLAGGILGVIADARIRRNQAREQKEQEIEDPKQEVVDADNK